MPATVTKFKYEAMAGNGNQVNLLQNFEKFVKSYRSSEFIFGGFQPFETRCDEAAAVFSAASKECEPI